MNVVKVSKITICRRKSNTKNNIKEKCALQKKTIEDVTTEPTTDKQTNN